MSEPIDLKTNTRLSYESSPPTSSTFGRKSILKRRSVDTAHINPNGMIENMIVSDKKDKHFNDASSSSSFEKPYNGSPSGERKSHFSRARGYTIGPTDNKLINADLKIAKSKRVDRKVSFSVGTPARTALEILQDQRKMGILPNNSASLEVASQLDDLRLIKLNAFKRAFLYNGQPSSRRSSNASDCEVIEDTRDWYEKRKVMPSGIIGQNLHHELVPQDLKNCTREGYLDVRSWNSFVKNSWKRRYCIIKDKWFIIMKNKESMEAIHIIPLSHCVLDSFNLRHKAFSLHRLGKYKLYVFEADSAELKTAWMEDILKGISVAWEAEKMIPKRLKNDHLTVHEEEGLGRRRHSISDPKHMPDIRSLRINSTVKPHHRVGISGSAEDKVGTSFSPKASSYGSGSYASKPNSSGTGSSTFALAQAGPKVEEHADFNNKFSGSIDSIRLNWHKVAQVLVYDQNPDMPKVYDENEDTATASSCHDTDYTKDHIGDEVSFIPDIRTPNIPLNTIQNKPRSRLTSRRGSHDRTIVPSPLGPDAGLINNRRRSVDEKQDDCRSPTTRHRRGSSSYDRTVSLNPSHIDANGRRKSVDEKQDQKQEESSVSPLSKFKRSSPGEPRMQIIAENHYLHSNSSSRRSSHDASFKSRRSSNDDTKDGRSLKQRIEDGLKNNEDVLSDELLKVVLENIDRISRGDEQGRSISSSDLNAVAQLFG